MPTALTSMQVYDFPFMIKIRQRFASTAVAIVANTHLSWQFQHNKPRGDLSVTGLCIVLLILAEIYSYR